MIALAPSRNHLLPSQNPFHVVPLPLVYDRGEDRATTARYDIDIGIDLFRNIVLRYCFVVRKFIKEGAADVFS